MEAYIRGCDVGFASKPVRHKPYGNLKFLPVPTHRWKDLWIDFIIRLSFLTNWNRDSCDIILVIIDWLIIMVYYKPVKTTIDAAGLAEIIINMIVRHHGLFELIVCDWDELLFLKFWCLLCYFLGIKQKLSTAFSPQTNGQTKRQNSITKAYLCVLLIKSRTNRQNSCS